ncbi:MAG: hypothetical protein M3R38_05975 [Actinomycetota bacterium]|nr:hypothetical protein [Actinomycetota bacterium]
MPVYNNFKEQLLRSAITDLSAGTTDVRVSLHGGYTPDIDLHAVFADVSATELTGTGYTAGGNPVGTKTVVQDNAADRGVFDGADVTWTGLSVGTPSHAIIRDATANILIGYWPITTASNGGDYTLVFDAAGIVYIA